MMKKKESLIYIFIAVVSAGLALLFAPNSGQVTRRRIKYQAKDMKDSLDKSKDNLIQDFKNSYFEAVDEVEKEYELLNDRQQELKETISSIESELTH